MYRQFCVTALVVLLLAQWQQEETITVDVDLVNVYFTVCNRKGRLVTTLDRNNFAVFEDGAPQVITNFSREADVPLRVAILMDTSGSVRYKLRLEQEAIIEFLYAALRGDRDKAA